MENVSTKWQPNTAWRKTTKWIKWQANTHTYRVLKAAYVLHKTAISAKDLVQTFLLALSWKAKQHWFCTDVLNTFEDAAVAWTWQFFPEQNDLNRSHMDGGEVLKMNNSSRVSAMKLQLRAASIVSCGKINTWAALKLMYWKPSFLSPSFTGAITKQNMFSFRPQTGLVLICLLAMSCCRRIYLSRGTECISRRVLCFTLSASR